MIAQCRTVDSLQCALSAITTVHCLQLSIFVILLSGLKTLWILVLCNIRMSWPECTHKPPSKDCPQNIGTSINFMFSLIMHLIFPTIVSRQLNASLINKDLKTGAVHLATPCMQSGFLVEENWFVDREGSYPQAIIFHLNLPCVCDKIWQATSCTPRLLHCAHV